MNTNNKWQNTAITYIVWLLVSTIAFSFLPIIETFASGFMESGFFLVLLVGVPVWVIIFGLVQARLLRQEDAGGILWIIVVACYVAIIVLTLNFNNSSSSIPAFIVGGVLGVIQFFILRKTASETIWWIPASMLAWGISYIFGLRLFLIFGFALSLIVVGIVNGIITGIPYAISFSKSKLETTERIVLVAISIFLLATIWLSVNAGLKKADSTFTISYNPTKVQFTLDSRFLAVAHSDGIEFRGTDGWEVTGSIAFKSKDRHVNEISFSPDGQTMAAALCCDENVIELWNTTNFQYVDTLRGHVKDIYTVAFSPDGRLIASGGKTNKPTAEVIIWDFASKRILQHIRFPQYYIGNEGVQQVAFSPDSKTLAISLPWGVGGEKIIFLDLISGKIIREIDLFKALFSKDWDYLAGASGETIRVVDVSTEKQLSSISLEAEHFSFSLANNVLIENSKRNMLRVWDIETGIIIFKLFPAPDFSITTVSPDGKWVVSAYQGASNSGCQGNCTVRVWNLEQYYP